MKPKVLFIVTSLNIGGLETYLLRFLTYYQDKLNSTVFCKSGENGELIPNFLEYGVNIKLQYLGFYSIQSWIKFYKYIKKEKFDVVCDFSGDFSGVSIIMAKLASIDKRIVFYRESEYQFKPTILKLLYAKFSNLQVKIFATKILSNSNANLDSFHPKWRFSKNKKYLVIPNGIPKPKINPKQINKIKQKLNISEDSFIIGHIGRFTNAKNHNTIIEIANVICKKYNNVYFLLCGKGIKESLGEEIIKLNLKEKIILPGVCKDIYSWHQIMNVFLFPSINEGQPNALLEAMVSGLPVITSNISSIVESVPKEIKNFMFDPTDKSSYINALENVIKGKIPYDLDKTKNWALEKYNSENNFNIFYKQLKNY